MSSQDGLQHAPARSVDWLAPLAAMTLVCVLALVARKTVLADDQVASFLSLPKNTPITPETFAGELRARTSWALAEIGLITAQCMAIVYLGGLLRARHRQWPVRSFELAVAAVLAACVVGAIALASPNVITDTIRACLPATTAATWSAWTGWSNCLAGIVVALIAVSFAIVARGSRVSGADLRAAEQSYQDLRTILLISSGLLVVATLELGALFHWPASAFSPKSAEYGLIQHLADTATLRVGGFFTLLLGAGFLSARAILGADGWRLERVHNCGPNAVSSNMWLSSHGMTFAGGWSAWTSALAVLAPLITGGTASQLIGKLGSIAD